jgi:two-component system, chemotaxis family, chemotaxis protein CheY
MKVLVIDDEAAIRALFSAVLRGAGHDVYEAGDGRAGLTLYHQHHPELVITDIIMPNQEGIETIRMLHRENPDVKIIAVSGGGRIGDLDFLRIAREFGAVATLAKPFRKQQLLDLLRDIGC